MVIIPFLSVWFGNAFLLYCKILMPNGDAQERNAFSFSFSFSNLTFKSLRDSNCSRRITIHVHLTLINFFGVWSNSYHDSWHYVNLWFVFCYLMSNVMTENLSRLVVWLVSGLWSSTTWCGDASSCSYRDASFCSYRLQRCFFLFIQSCRVPKWVTVTPWSTYIE